ncbi:MAG TPA: hypothetical protein VFK41_12180 [Nocardioidaceae bacterium]|nr:hypothetical protein [Nocardioidaceae bacterium]
MPFLLLYGVGGWTARWEIDSDEVEPVRSEILRVGGAGSSELSVLDPGSDTPAQLVVCWAAVAAAVLIDGDPTPQGVDGSGQYA